MTVLDPHQHKIIEAAKKLNIEVEILTDTWHIDAIRLTYQGESELVVYGRLLHHLSANADLIGAHKVAAKALMAELGIPVPAGVILNATDLNAQEIQSFLNEYQPAVAKPLYGSEGYGIGMHLTTAEDVIQHIRNFPDTEHEWLLEEQVSGEDLRLQYLDGQIIAACVRRPCCVCGDGKRTIAELIASRNELIQSQNADNWIAIDHQVNRRLQENNLSLDAVLAEGVELQLKDVSNMAQGGHAVDVTDRIHPTYLQYMDRLSKALKIRLVSLDVMTLSPEADPEQHAHILEFNAQPAWMHHTFSEGRQHDMPTIILKNLFGID